MENFTSINTIQIVIGSWGSYNACNSKALGSKWLDLANYDTWEEIELELEKEGFDLNGIDEELFIQDIDGFNTNDLNCDYMHPKRFFNLIKESEVLENTYNYSIMEAFLEVKSFDEFEDRVNIYGSNWTDEIHLYQNFDWADYGKEYFDMYGYELPSNLEDFIDFEAYGQYIGSDYAEEFSNGIIEIIR